MPGPAFRISIEIGHLLPTGGPVDSGAMTNLSDAVKDIAEAAQAKWRAFARGETMPNGKSITPRSGAYEQSITLRQTGEFSAEIFSDLAYAASIEDGYPSRDLKRMLDKSLKVRLTKDGRRYLIIPFRWLTPGGVGLDMVMPQVVHDWWQKKSRVRSSEIGEYQRPSGTGAYDIHSRTPISIPSKIYSWGSRLKKKDLSGLGITGASAKHMAGMVNFRNPGSVGGSKHSQYLTFRVMVEGGKGWVTKPVDGKHPAQQVADIYQNVASEVIPKAVEADVRSWLGQS
ncbi:MAG: hypothetical protein GC191_09200 [Azospirillum sp.]|nr:hypothetical protein [Azospirillum sp.]